jgi:hypothetical protein
MVNSNIAGVYQPLISPSDRLVRQPITPWRMAMVRMLREGISKKELDYNQIGSALNRLALLEAYQGHTGRALMACDAQIRFWQRSAEEPGHAHLLPNIVQPWINILRLERWNNRLDSSISLYRELAPDRRAAPAAFQQRFGIPLTFDALDGISPGRVSYLLDMVYWREYGNLLFSAGADVELRQHLQAGIGHSQYFVRAALLEMLLVRQADSGNHAGTLALLRRIRRPDTGAYWLHFKTLEMYLALRTGADDAEVLLQAVLDAALSSEHIERDGAGLALLFDIAKLFARLGMHEQEEMLLQRAYRMAQELNDEVVLFEVMDRLAVLGHDLGCDVRERFAASSYALIRKRLGQAPRAADTGPDVVQALRALAELDFDTCMLFLDNKEQAERYGLAT